MCAHPCCSSIFLSYALIAHGPQAVLLVAAGADVARKVVILARECGLQLSLSELQVSSLVPQPLAAVASVEDFMQQLPQVRGL